MKRTLALVMFSGLLACGDDTVASATVGDATGGPGPGSSGSSVSESTSDTTAADGGSEDSSAVTGDSGGSDTTAGVTPRCRVEVVASMQLSPERFGTLTRTEGDPEHRLVGAWGWTLAGSVETPVVERFWEPAEPMSAGRMGPDGEWAYLEHEPGLVRVLPLGDPGAVYETPTARSPGPSVVGDVNDDGVDDLVFVDAGTYTLWQADGLGGFAMVAASQESYPDAFSGFASPTDVAAAAVLVGQSDSGVLGLELADDVLVKAYAVELGFVWSMQGVPPPAGAGRSILVAREGGVLIDPLEGWVGFLDGQAGTWTRRGLELGRALSAPPAALDLDADGVLDAVAATGDTLQGACAQDEMIVPCLDAPLTGATESIAVQDGVVFVATADEGLWAYVLGACE